MSSLARLWRHKDGRAPSSIVKKLAFTAVYCLVRLKTVLYRHVPSLHGILPCLTASSRRLLCSASNGRLSWGEQAYRILSQYPAILDIATAVSLNQLSGFFR